jgi:hypothetical protein
MAHVQTLPAEFLILSVSMWFAIGAVLSLIGGWWSLVRRFTASERPTTRLKLTSARVGATNYNNCLYVAYAPEGIYLRVVFLFRFLHPPLLIPWSAVRWRGRKKPLLFSWDVLEIEGPSATTIQIRLPVPQEYLERLQDGAIGVEAGVSA